MAPSAIDGEAHWLDQGVQPLGQVTGRYHLHRLLLCGGWGLGGVIVRLQRGQSLAQRSELQGREELIDGRGVELLHRTVIDVQLHRH